MALSRIQELLAEGPLETSIMSVGGNTQVALKVEVTAADNVGILCRAKGMLGGYGGISFRPWASIAWMQLPE